MSGLLPIPLMYFHLLPVRTAKFPHHIHILGLPTGLDGKESAIRAGDLGLIPESGWSHGEENGNPLQYSCLENSINRGAWWNTVHGVAKDSLVTRPSD